MTLKTKILIMVGAVVGFALIGVGVLAASGWLTKTVNTGGTITVTPAANFDFTVPSSIDFTTSVASGGSVVISNNILITNTGNQPINGITAVSNVTNLPPGLSVSFIYPTFPIAPSSSENLVVRITGTAPASPAPYPLGGTISVTPN